MSSSPVAGTYTSREEFLERAIRPIGERLSQPIRPTVQRIITEGDTAVVLWDGHAMAKDGKAYDNRYCWVMRIGDGKVKEAAAFSIHQHSWTSSSASVGRRIAPDLGA